MTFSTVDHVGFTVSDMDRSVAWYERFLQTPPQFRGLWDASYIGTTVGYPGCVMECTYFQLPGRTRLELVHYRSPAVQRVDMETYNVGNGHLCLYVDDLAVEFNRLRGWAELRSDEPVAITWGPFTGGWGGYIRDPDGITIQLLQPPATPSEQ